MGEINFSLLTKFYLNHSMGYLVPIKQTEVLDANSMDYRVENVFALFTIKITDKTFGEIVMDLNEFRGLPECKSIREMQYRVMVKPTDMNNSTNSLDNVGKGRIEPIFEYLSPRIPYEIANISNLAVARELVIGVKMKDIFSNKKLFMTPGAKDVYGEHDQRIFIDFFATDKLATKMLVAQREFSLVELIQAHF